ncbi:MAG: PTS transporter subunit EIIC [Oligoflexia bacterium]|nr:PTS transporter subunit EIIC [Oligoflexia bacterium]
MNELKKIKTYLLSGVSYAIPFVASGGILIALSIAFVPMSAQGPDFSNSPIMKLILDIGTSAFKLLVPVLSGYIAFGMVNRPGLVPGLVGGVIANEIGAGFLGGIVSGLLAGYVVMVIKKIKFPKFLVPVMPILILPALSTLIVGFIMYKILGVPIKDLMNILSSWLSVMGTGNSVVLAIILGAMIAFDMGGPINKTAFFFAAAMIKEGHFNIMGACAAAICIPPLGLGLATITAKSLWSEQERDAGKAALGMGIIGITEGAIPFAAGDPIRVIPTIMLSSIIGAVIAMLGKVGDHAPHGGLIVLPVIDNKLNYVLAILVGSVTCALLINVLKKLKAKKNKNLEHIV